MMEEKEAFKLSKELKDDLDDYTKDNDINKSQTIRRALRTYFDDNSITCNISNENMEKLDERADKEGKTRCDVIDNMLEQFLADDYLDLEDRVEAIEHALIQAANSRDDPAVYLPHVRPRYGPEKTLERKSSNNNNESNSSNQ